MWQVETEEAGVLATARQVSGFTMKMFGQPKIRGLSGIFQIREAEWSNFNGKNIAQRASPPKTHNIFALFIVKN
jgi:hypothetical protein